MNIKISLEGINYIKFLKTNMMIKHHQEDRWWNGCQIKRLINYIDHQRGTQKILRLISQNQKNIGN